MHKERETHQRYLFFPSGKLNTWSPDAFCALPCGTAWQKACSPGHPVNKHWWERKGEWSYGRLMRLLWHGLLPWGTAPHRVSGCLVHICQPMTEARAQNGGWSSGTGLAPWSMKKTTWGLISSDIQAPEIIPIIILGHFRWILSSALSNVPV